ncbi:MAG: hypothetical protein DWI00_05680 [Planctomycetota bacterium]|nr:MAG: hypothetical protein DWI00_05680 [Planctomycetota bacterium]
MPVDEIDQCSICAEPAFFVYRDVALEAQSLPSDVHKALQNSECHQKDWVLSVWSNISEF